MGLSKSGIPYLTHTWNPAVGCKHGCTGCWAQRLLKRIGANIGCELCVKGVPHIHPERWEQVTPKQKHAVIGVGFMADLCGEWDWPRPGGGRVDTEMLLWTFLRRGEYYPQHTFVSLTQRPDRLPRGWDWDWPGNWWWGTTVRNQEEADERIPALLASGVPHPLVSYEPATGPVDFGSYGWLQGCSMCCTKDREQPCKHHYRPTCPYCHGNPTEHGHRLSGIIAGGQSGPGRVRAEVDWFRAVRDQCADAGVPFALKQNG